MITELLVLIAVMAIVFAFVWLSDEVTRIPDDDEKD